LEEQGFLFSLGRMGKALKREFEARVEPLDLTAPQIHALHRLWKGDGVLTTELARDICMDGGTITGLLDRLEAKAFIRRERSTEDRRAVRIFLTDTGRSLEEPVRVVGEAVNRLAMEGFTPEEQAQLLRALERVAVNLGA
jgi:DNA-binding MarR family transcriptional regulator